MSSHITFGIQPDGEKYIFHISVGHHDCQYLLTDADLNQLYNTVSGAAKGAFDDVAKMKWADLHGYMPEITEGLPVDEYLRQVRYGAEEEE